MKQNDERRIVWTQTVEEMRIRGLHYGQIANELGCDYQKVKDYCKRHGLTLKDLGQQKITTKGHQFIDWNKKVFDVTCGAFELIASEAREDGERTLEVRCTECGSTKIISSISIRGKHTIRCNECDKKRTKDRHRAEAQDRFIREWKKNYQRGLCLVQMEMNFCKCGQLLPFGVRVCAECKRKSARQCEKRKEHKRRAWASAEFDKTITLEKLYERDNGVCYLCNKVCDWSDFQKINGNFITGGSYPTIEHVKALCHGGTHTWGNVKLACFACNTKKGSKVLRG